MYKIYYLTSDYDNYHPRYIGYTSLELDKRLYHHIRESKYDKSKHKSHKINWIVKLLEKNMNIEIFLIQDHIETLDEILILERYYIEKYEKNCSLTNSTNGGEISKTYKNSVKDQIKSSLKEYFSKNNAWNKGLTKETSSSVKSYSDKNRGKIRPELSGSNNHFYNKKHTKETRKIISDKNRKHRIYPYNELYYLYIELNLNQKEIAKELELTRPYVCRLIKKNKLMKIKLEKYGKIK
jgi:DNA-directed RNA polymerase specialized sigma subunit